MLAFLRPIDVTAALVPPAAPACRAAPSPRRTVAGRRAAGRTIAGLPHSAVAALHRRRSPRLHLLTCTAHRSPLHAIAKLDI